MKKRILYALLATVLVASCQKADDNGDLGGNWKLLQIEDFAKDTIVYTKEMQRFWAIQLDLIQIGNGKGRFQHVGDSLYVQMIIMPKKPEEYGLFNPGNERFGVIHLDRSRMVLRSMDATLTLKKF